MKILVHETEKKLSTLLSIGFYSRKRFSIEKNVSTESLSSYELCSCKGFVKVG